MLQRMLAAATLYSERRQSDHQQFRFTDDERERLVAQTNAMGRQLIANSPHWQSVLQMPHRFYPGLYAQPWHTEPGSASLHSGALATARKFLRLGPLFTLLRDAAPALRKEYRKLRRQKMLQTDEDCIQQPGGRGRWRRFEVGAIWQDLDHNTSCSVHAPVGCQLVAQLRASRAAPILRAGYSSIGAGGWIRPHFGPTNAQVSGGLVLPFCLEVRAPSMLMIGVTD